MTGWSFQRTLITGLILMGLLAILSSVASLLASRILVASMEQVAADVARDLTEAEKLQVLGARKVAGVRAYLLTGEDVYGREARLGSAAVRNRIRRLEARVSTREARELLARIGTSERAHQDWFERARALREAHAPRGQLAVFVTESVEPRALEFERALDAFVGRMEGELMGGLQAARASVARARRVLQVVTYATMVSVVLLSLILQLSLSRSYRKQASARAVAEARNSRARAAQWEAEAASRLKDEFLATVSHELRNPLAPILAWTQLLRSGSLDREKTLRAVEAIERSARSQVQLIDDLLDVSSAASGTFRLDMRPIELASVVRAAVESQRPASEVKQIELQLDLDQRPTMISGDAERLQQVVWNLLSNAIKFSPSAGRVQVVLQRDRSRVVLSVSDTGQGIDPAFLPHVFEPFRQEASGSARYHRGLGLGLSIVRHIVELHGGEITAHSEGRGKGSTFQVELPTLAIGEHQAESGPKRLTLEDRAIPVAFQRLDGIRVLVVDDDPGTIEAVAAILDSRGAGVQTAGSVARALEVFDTWKPDVVLSDIGMPEQDGFALIRQVRKRSSDKGGDIPAVALTAYTRIEDRIDILNAGFQMYVSKPTDPSELVAVIGSLAARLGAGDDSRVVPPAG
ncbi:MAG TPA: ATP-binding protein [Candidatus Eisenbacteria bacterium]|jgi:signal transduction histidine kinase/ActR/RegA family two-component response regulator